MGRVIFCILLLTQGHGLANAREYDDRSDINADGMIDSADSPQLQRSWHGVAPTPTATPPAALTPAGEITVELPDLPAGAKPLTLVRIPAGSFQMGSYDESSWSWCYPCEQPAHTVKIGYDFYVGKHEITQGQWLAVMGSEPASGYGDGNDYPVYYVSWNDCQAFVAALNALGQGTFRMPSEAEWEYACRAGTTTRFSFGDSNCAPTGCTSCDLSNYAWWCGNNGASGTPEYGTKVVGQKLPNGFGLYDMHGNVWEWCQDWWHEGYTGAPADGSAWEAGGGTHRVIRGGSWIQYNARLCRSSGRGRNTPTSAHLNLGFRVARTP